MGKFRVDIIIKNAKGEKEVLTYKENQLVDFETNTFSTSNPTRLDCNSYPSEGTVVIKDTNLELYNRAINGAFDNTFNFEVLIYKGNNVFARHIVNQRPRYNYSNKTLTLNLGNEIDLFDNILIKGFSYDNKSNKTAKDLIEELLKEHFPDYTISFSISGTKLSPIKNIYFPKNQTLKEALRQLLEILGASIVMGSDKNFTILGLSNTPTTISPIKVLPKNIQGSFLPDIILDNRFTNIKLNSKNIYEKKEKQTIVTKNFDTSYLDNSDEYVTRINFKQLSSFWEGGAVYVYLRHLGQSYDTVVSYISKNFNNNLSQILSLEIGTFNSEGVYDNSSPIFSTICKKVVYNYLGNEFIDKITDFNITNANLWQKESEEIVEVSDLYKTSVSYTEEGKHYREGLDDNLPQFEYRVDTNIENSFYLEEEEMGYYFYCDALCGKKYLKTIDKQVGAFGSEIKTQLVNYLPISISVSFSGIVEEIKFEDKTISSTNDNANVYENPNENYFLQQGLNYTSENSIAKEVVSNYQQYFKNGIRTGTISCVFADYFDKNGKVKDIDTMMYMNQYLIPCRDNSGKPIMTKKYLYPNYKTISYNITGTTSSTGVSEDVGVMKYPYKWSRIFDKDIKNVNIYNVSSNATATYYIS